MRYTWGSTPTDYRYTGQLEEGEIGLYFYRSRWYDASLGRFVQGDTVVPGVGNPLAYDRYSYSFNNPVRYIDPSGHISCNFSHAAPGDCYDPPPPTSVNPDRLSDEPGGKTGISGQDFYQWYLDLYNDNTGWWWDVFGKDEDGFTIWDAFAVIYVFETYGNWSSPYVAEAAIRDANTWCQGQGRRQACITEDYINHFAHEYQSAGNYVGRGYTLHDPRKWFASFTSADAQALNGVAASFANHPVAWNEGCKPTQPCGWANNHPDMYSREIREHLHKNQSALFVYAPSGIALSNLDSIYPWFIPSGCVYQWLAGKLNTTCAPVR